jgi:hypothetical protein
LDASAAEQNKKVEKRGEIVMMSFGIQEERQKPLLCSLLSMVHNE